MARLRAARPTNPMRRRLAAMVLVVVGIAGLGVASAAQLNVSNGSLGAGTAVVASCQPAGQVISVSFTTGFASGAYQATAVTLSNVNSACGGGAYRISVLNTAGTALAEVTGTVPAAGGAVNSPTFGAIAVTSISSVAVVIQK